jgi:hypothetical protein
LTFEILSIYGRLAIAVFGPGSRNLDVHKRGGHALMGFLFENQCAIWNPASGFGRSRLLRNGDIS